MGMQIADLLLQDVQVTEASSCSIVATTVYALRPSSPRAVFYRKLKKFTGKHKLSNLPTVIQW